MSAWSDEEIISRYKEAFGEAPDVHHMAFLRWLRDDCQERINAPDPQDYTSADEYSAAAEKYDYHKYSRPGESMAEYRARLVTEADYEPGDDA